MDFEALRKKMKAASISIDELAKRTGINRATMFRRFQKEDDFSVKEALNISKVLNLTQNETIDIFFYKMSNI